MLKWEFLCAKIYIESIVIKNVIRSEDTLMDRTESPSNFCTIFTHNQAEQIKKAVICVQIVLETHLTEHSRFHFSMLDNFIYTPVLVTVM